MSHSSPTTHLSSLITHHSPLVLASGSAIRAQMLKGCGLQFSVVPSNVDEEEIKSEFVSRTSDFAALAKALARAKALNVSAGYPDALTIGADQLCVLPSSTPPLALPPKGGEGEHGTIFDKPATRSGAIAQLEALQGKEHLQISAVCVARGAEVLWEHQERAVLTMRPLKRAEIEAYISADDPLKSCGAYKYESLGKHLFQCVSGNDDVIKGLPLQALIYQLHQMGAIGL